MSNILAKIVEDKRVEVAKRKQDFPQSEFIDQLVQSEKSFFDALKNADVGYILECKKASPSKGLIRAEFDLNEICGTYKHYASCISVLTDEKYFQGSFDYLKQVTQMVDLPVICKDFFVDSYQVHLARLNGADAILLMLSVLDDDQYQQLAELAASYKMDVLTEVSNEEEMARALKLDAKILGINNRNLRDLSTDTNRTFELVAHIPDDKRNNRLIISESGIYHHQQVKQLSTVADGFLVGSSLMSQDDIDGACRRMIYGEHKICGMNKPADAIAAYNAGASFGGLIFFAKSPRNVTLEQATEVVNGARNEGANLSFVGVFVNEQVATVASHAKALKLAAVQLHGKEDQDYIDQLRPLLPTGCEIFKAKAVKDELPAFAETVDRFVLDTFHQQLPGGSGKTFDWQLLDDLPQDQKFMIAGGLNADNIPQAYQHQVIGLDINSGVEDSPGVKNPQKITHALNLITGAPKK